MFCLTQKALEVYTALSGENMQNTLKTILNFVPFCEQEDNDKNYALHAFKNFSNILTRESVFCHTTSSAFILNKSHTKVLFCLHKIYNSWSVIGGHTDGVDDPLFVAKKEAQEETGLVEFFPLSKNPVSLDVLVTPGHTKHGRFVCGHTHINLTFVFEADDSLPLTNAPEENFAVKWLELDKLLELSNEPYMKKIYKKIIYKIKNKLY